MVACMQCMVDHNATLLNNDQSSLGKDGTIMNIDRRRRSTDIICTYYCQQCRSFISHRSYCYTISPRTFARDALSVYA